MMNNFQCGSLPSEASSLLSSPQDALKNCETDYTSIFGTQKNMFLKEVPIKRDVENNETPFSFRTVIDGIFGGISHKDIPMANKNISLHFEC